MIEKYILYGVFTKFATKTYPQTPDYTKYIWNETKENWELNPEWVNFYITKLNSKSTVKVYIPSEAGD